MSNGIDKDHDSSGGHADSAPAATPVPVPVEPAPSAAGSAEHHESFGPYEVGERLGIGGMATVHRARERGIEGFERVVALKRLLPHLAEDAQLVKSFVREAKLASALQHINIAQIYELGRVGATYFIAMEHIEGVDVRKMLKQARRVAGPPPIDVAVAILLELCDALDYAHTQTDANGDPLGLIHRDISPSNLILAASGHLKVIDFGIAKATSHHLRTQTGRVKGKLAYMAPEAIRGGKLDARSDLFSAGVVAHEILTARPLFAAKTEYETLTRIQRGEVPAPSMFNPEVPPELDAVVQKVLAVEPDDRYPSAAELSNALDHIRAQYGLSALSRDVADWLSWAFSLGGEDTGRVRFVTRTGSRPIRAPTGIPFGSGSNSPVVEMDDDVASIAWGGADAAVPVILDEVPDVSEKHAVEVSMDEGVTGEFAPMRTLQGHRIGQSGPFHRPTTRPPSASDLTPLPGPPPGGLLGRSSTVIKRFPRPSSASDAGAWAGGSDPDALRARAGTIGAGILDRRVSWKQRAILGGLIAAAILTVVVLAVTLGGEGPENEPATPVATLRFVIEPEGATVVIDGDAQPAKDGLAVKLSAGSHKIEIRHAGYKTWISPIEVRENEAQTLRVALAPGGSEVATLQITSTPTGLTVHIDGEAITEVTPATIEVAPGPHSVAVSDGHGHTWREQIKAAADTQYAFHAALEGSARHHHDHRGDDRSAPASRKAADHQPAARTSAPAPAASPAPAHRARPRATHGFLGQSLPVAVPVPPKPAPVDDKPAIVPPRSVHKVAGDVPDIRLRNPESAPARVSVKLCIDTAGHVTSAKVLNNVPQSLRRQIERGLRDWRYQPYERDGRAHSACFAISIRIHAR